MNKPLLFLALLGAILVISACKKDDDAIDKFEGNFTGTYEIWDCGSGGNATRFFTLENTTLNVKKTGSESAEVTCTLPVIGEAFKCQGTISSDSTLVMTGCVHDGDTYNGEFILQANGGKIVHLFDPSVNCTSAGAPIGNIVWRSN
jgi:uncharacterized protein (DUF2147 family)